MKYKWLVGVSLLLLMLVGSAVAQPVLRVNVPFAFTAGHTLFPAGAYTVETLSTDVLVIRGASSMAFVPAMRDESPRLSYASKLLFQRSGDTYLLSQVSGAGTRWDVRSFPSHTSLAKESTPVEIGGASQH